MRAVFADFRSMSVAFDTLRFSQRLCEAGMSDAQAAGITAATAQAVGELVAQLATKQDLALLRQEMRQEMREAHAALREELRADQASFREEIRADQARLREELRADQAALRADHAALRQEVKADIAQLELRMTLKLGTMMTAAVAVTAALVKLL
jgi:ABC-type transporter MlaC component